MSDPPTLPRPAERLNMQLEDDVVIGDHAEWLLSKGIPLSEVLAFAVALEDMRAVPAKVEVSFSADAPDTERQQRSSTWPATYAA